MATRIEAFYTEKVGTRLFVSDCAACGVVFGIPEEMEQRRRKDAKDFYCPNGHTLSFGKSEAEKLREQLKNAESSLNWYSDRLASARREHEATANTLRTTKGHLTRLRTRAEAGVCIHCHRQFQNVQRHMASKHREARDGD